MRFVRRCLSQRGSSGRWVVGAMAGGAMGGRAVAGGGDRRRFRVNAVRGGVRRPTGDSGWRGALHGRAGAPVGVRGIPSDTRAFVSRRPWRRIHTLNSKGTRLCADSEAASDIRTSILCVPSDQRNQAHGTSSPRLSRGSGLGDGLVRRWQSGRWVVAAIAGVAAGGGVGVLPCVRAARRRIRQRNRKTAPGSMNNPPGAGIRTK